VVRRSSILLGVAAVLALTGSSGISSAVGGGTASAEAVAIQVSVPGREGASAGAVSGPPDAVGIGGAFAYPADGSIARASSVASSVSGAAGAASTASATTTVSGLSLFGGEVTVSSITAKATAQARGKAVSGGTSGSGVNGLVVGGQGVSTAPGTSAALGDWGTAAILQGASAAYSGETMPGYAAGITALHVSLTAEHAGLPAGTQIVVGFVDVEAQGAPPAEKPKPAKPEKSRQKPRASAEKVGKKEDGGRASGPVLVRPVPTDVIPRLTASGYVFPVYGTASFSNTFNAPRGAYVGGWHHGEDIFAPLGAPVLAVANGIVYSVGWNDVGGLRLWLQDTAGNEFYYAHLSAFSPLAVNGASVRAGDVLGFIGNTGDAQGTPYHVHFEIHPVSLLYLGYDGGAVAPYPYLMAWRRLTDISLTGVAEWAPPLAGSSRAPRPGAILLQTRDISSASGLEPGSLRRALRASGDSSADGALAGVVPRGREGLRALARTLGGP